MGGLRTRLAARTDGPVTAGPHMVFFVHDELVVHAPAADAEWVAEQVRAAAVDAGRIMFGGFPVTFPLTVAVVRSYDQAK